MARGLEVEAAIKKTSAGPTLANVPQATKYESVRRTGPDRTGPRALGIRRDNMVAVSGENVRPRIHRNAVSVCDKPLPVPDQ
jgi:hypothetical protein